MKKNWIGRSIVSLFVVCIGLYGSWYSSSQPFEEYIINLIILGPTLFCYYLTMKRETERPLELGNSLYALFRIF